MSSATVSFKKKDGTLSISDDKKYLFWTQSPNNSPTVTVPVGDVTNLQQTPESSAKVALKVFVKDDNYVFSFTHASNARKEQEAITDTLRNTIAANKAPTAASLAPSVTAAPGTHSNDAGPSAAMAISKAVSSKPDDESWYDDNKLMSDTALQRSLLESDKNLKESFNSSLKQKPESVSISQFTAQFWSSRLHQLRIHAVEAAQKRGDYNVLPEIRFIRKPAEKEGEPDTKQLHITKEQIKLIFKQYPVVSQAYNENCPPLNTGEFWTRFFNSRLLKKLKGEKISQVDPSDSYLDKYLDRTETSLASITAHIPHFIDLEGNEQNHSQRKGNRPDQDMRPSSYEKVPILRVLNNLSANMMSSVAPEDGEAHAPIGMNEDTFEQLRLRDLAKDDVNNRVRLNVKEQSRSLDAEDDLSADAKLYARQDPEKVLPSLRNDLQSAFQTGPVQLGKIIGFQSDEDSDSDDGKGNAKTLRVGSHIAMSAAMSTVIRSVKQNAGASNEPDLDGLKQPTFEALQEVNNTTTEFLRHFWSLFLSGDDTRADELTLAVTMLDRSLDRIRAVGDAAEAERQEKITSLKKQIEDQYRKTGRRRKVDFDAVVPGGRSAVETMIRPTVYALTYAMSKYKEQFDKQSRDPNP